MRSFYHPDLSSYNIRPIADRSRRELSLPFWSAGLLTASTTHRPRDVLASHTSRDGSSRSPWRGVRGPTSPPVWQRRTVSGARARPSGAVELGRQDSDPCDLGKRACPWQTLARLMSTASSHSTASSPHRKKLPRLVMATEATTTTKKKRTMMMPLIREARQWILPPVRLFSCPATGPN